jgi:hypothetical protein
MDERKKLISTPSIDRGGYAGRLVAFVDMKVDELVDDDKTLLEINTGTGTPNAYVVYNRKKSFKHGSRVKGDLVTGVQQSEDRDTKLSGWWSRKKVSRFPALLSFSRCAPLIRRPRLTVPKVVSTTLAWANRRPATSNSTRKCLSFRKYNQRCSK